MDTAQAGEKLQCESQSAGDTRDFACPLQASGTLQHFRFRADFAGSHDDTVASMVAGIDGSPLACEAGSKTRLMGEDGEVSLECRFSIAESAGSQHSLTVTLSWSHAQYTGFELAAD